MYAFMCYILAFLLYYGEKYVTNGSFLPLRWG